MDNEILPAFEYHYEDINDSDPACDHCKFPFIYQEEIHYDCVSNDFDGKSWCPRQLDENRYPIQGHWITCPTEKCSGFL